MSDHRGPGQDITGHLVFFYEEGLILLLSSCDLSTDRPSASPPEHSTRFLRPCLCFIERGLKCTATLFTF